MHAHIAVLVSTLCAASCSNDHPGDAPSSAGSAVAASGPVTAGNVVEIQTNTQGTFSDVRIGAGNFREEEYTDAAGKKSKGWTAGLWISVRGDASQDRQIRAFPGLKFDAGSKSFEVKSVEERVVTLAHAEKPKP